MRSSGSLCNETQSNRNSAPVANFQRFSNCGPGPGDRELAMVPSFVIRAVCLHSRDVHRLGDSGVLGVAGFCSLAKRGEPPITRLARSEWASLDGVVLRSTRTILCRCAVDIWNGDSVRV